MTWGLTTQPDIIRATTKSQLFRVVPSKSVWPELSTVVESVVTSATVSFLDLQGKLLVVSQVPQDTVQEQE